MTYRSEHPSFAYLFGQALQTWPWLLLALLVSAGLAAGVVRIWPWFYRAEVSLTVHIGLIRPVDAPAELLYIQTEHIRDALTHPRVLEDVHAHLPPEVQRRYSPEALARRLVVDWRLPQRWYLVAYARDAYTARLLVETWAERLEAYWIPQWERDTQTYLDLQRRIAFAREESLRLARIAAMARKGIAVLEDRVRTWRDLPPDAPLSPAEEAEVRYWAAWVQVVPGLPSVALPAAGTPRGQYRTWVMETLLPQLKAAAQAAEAGAQAAETQLNRLHEEEVRYAGFWLSPWYPVTLQRDGDVRLTGSPATATAAVLGMVVGLAAWLVGVLARTTLPPVRSSQEQVP